MITTRFAIDSDRAQLYSLVSLIANFNPEEVVLAHEVIDSALASPANGYELVVAEDEGNIVGFICFGPIPITINRFDLYWIAVDPRQERRGIGSGLLADMEARLGVGSRIYVDTSSPPGYEAARRFYERHGYQLACTLPDFYRLGDDKVIYCKDL